MKPQRDGRTLHASRNLDDARLSGQGIPGSGYEAGPGLRAGVRALLGLSLRCSLDAIMFCCPVRPQQAQIPT